MGDMVTNMDSVFEITQDAFDSLLVRNSGVMHKLADAVYGKSKIWLCKRKILKVAYNTPVERWILKSGTISGSEFFDDRHGGNDRFSCQHIGFFEEVENIFML